MPLDFPRPAILSSEGARIDVTIPEKLTREFSETMHRANSNMFVGLLSLYMTLLHCWGGGEDFAVGVAMANRHHEGLDRLIGYFANEVAIRADFSNDKSFLDVVEHIHRNVLEAMANADTPFHEVTKALNVTRDRSRTSVFQAMFALQEREWHSVDDLSPQNGDLSFSLKRYNHNTSKFEVHLQLRYDGRGGLEGDFHIATDLFTVETGERLVEAYKKLMEACIRSCRAPVLQHDITPIGDERTVMRCNSTNVRYDDTTILQKLEAVDRDSVAFISHGTPNRQHTYGEFLRAGMHLAHYLKHVSCVKRLDRIGVLMNNSFWAMSMILGVFTAGCTHVIIDMEKTPMERCEMIFRDADVKLILVEDADESMESLRCKGFTVISQKMVHDAAGETSLPTGPLSLFTPQPLRNDDPFGIYYTSGTTGEPKGAIITVSNVHNLSNWWIDFFSLRSRDRVLLFSSLSFIMSLRQCLPTLCAGATVILPQTSLDFENAIVQNEVYKIICTPSALATLDITKMNGVEAVQVAGEAPSWNTLVAWRNNVTMNLFIGLGPTELCAHALCGRFDGETLSIGHPAHNVRAYVVNPKYGKEVPIHVVGELWVAGANVANGYLNRPTTRFSIDPFRADGIRMYKTGDLARRLPDGRIQFVGRGDGQVKVHGFRIEIGDIVNAMPPCVKSAHVVVQEGELVAYVTPEVEKQQVVMALESKLPTYMIPRIIVPLPNFPLNKNKKVDAKALLQLGQNILQNQQDKKDDNEEFNYIENIIRLLWTEVLKIPPSQLSKRDNFFEKGGTSLSAVILSRKLSKELSAEVSVHDVFRHQTIQSLGDSIRKSDNDVVHRAGRPDVLVYLPGGNRRLHPTVFAVMQAIGLAVMSLLVAVPLLTTVFISTRAIIWFGKMGVLLLPPLLIAGCLFHMSLAIACKWIIIGRYRPGKARVFSWMFLKWWLVRRITHVTRLYTWVFDETAMSRIWLILLGVKVGTNISIEQPFILEPDLVTIGNSCVIEFESQFSTSEIHDGILEFREVCIGDRVKLGARSVLLGSAYVHDGCEVLSKSLVDFHSSSAAVNQVVGGAPAQIVGETDGDIWRKKRRWSFLFFQMMGIIIQVFLMAGIVFIGIEIGLLIREKYGDIPMVAYLASVFLLISAVLFLGVLVLLRRILIPHITPNKTYSSSWFAWRKWFLDRLFLSPLFAYASQRTLQTSSTFPWYLKLLGARIGQKAWMNHPFFRVGVELIDVGSDVHMGMLSYFTTEKSTKEGISFSSVYIGDHVSFGQRCVVHGGATIKNNATVGAETVIPHDFSVSDGGTTFGSPPVLFNSVTSYQQIIQQTKESAKELLASRKRGSDSLTELSFVSMQEETKTVARRQDVGKGMFWTYVFIMLAIQALLPVAIGSSYAAVYFLMTTLAGEVRLEHIILGAPVLYILGSIFLMIMLKLMQSLGGGFSIGTSNFFSLRFFYWHIFADMVYLCTSSVIYPFSGTQLYCMWLRLMNAKVGKRAFISPENGGFREIDFLDVGNDCVLMTPNIHAHYTDHGMLQFCPVKLEERVEINFGATIMPLTQYGKGSRLRPFAITVKGQHCEEETEYFGNPCKAVKDMGGNNAAIIFPGQGVQYAGMLDKVSHLSQEMIATANEMLGLDIVMLCSIEADDKILENTRYAQPLMFIAGLMHAEYMRQQHPLEFSKVVAVAGFSLGELTALCFAGAISFKDCLKLVKARANAMQKCNGGAMCNIQGLPFERVSTLCNSIGCTIANIICNHADPELIEKNIYVCSRTPEQIDQIVEAVLSNCNIGMSGKAKRLRVSGAFHSQHMKSAQHALKQVLRNIEIKLSNRCLVYSNVTGQPYSSVSEIRKLLVKQIVKPVQWHNTIKDMIEEESVVTMLECGPMTSLSKTVPAIVGDLEKSEIVIISSDGENKDETYCVQRHNKRSSLSNVF